MSRLRPALLAAAALLALSACDRGRRSDDDAPAPAPAKATSPAPAPVAPPAPAAAVPTVAAGDRRRTLREEKDGAAEVDSAPEYEGARGAATALPSHGDDAPATSADTPPATSPPPPPPGQPPG